MVCLRRYQKATVAAHASSHQYHEVVGSVMCLHTGISEKLDDSVSSVELV